jgi:hypothetical protein
VPLLPAHGFGSFDAPVVAFANARAQTRAERRAACDREHLEKERLKQRRSGFVDRRAMAASELFASPGEAAPYPEALRFVLRDLARLQSEAGVLLPYVAAGLADADARLTAVERALQARRR